MGEKTVDMTKGSILPKMIRFALPVLLGMLFQRIYNFVDVYIVGRYLGDEALAAVSIAGGAMYLLFSIMMGLTTGVSVVVSQYYGGGDEKKVTETFVSSIYVAVVSTLIITIAGLIGARPLLRILQTSNDLIDQATVYLMVVFAGAVGTMLYNWISAVLRSLGNSVVPLVFLIISSVLNVILDIVFVVWIPMGVAGAAFATVLAQLLSGIGCLVYAWKILPILQFTKEELRCDRELVKQMLIYGVPTGLQMRWQMAEAIGTSLGTFTGQNVGANHLDRVKQGVRCAYLMNAVCYGIFCPVIWFFARPIMEAFTGNPESIRYGVEYMKVFSCFFFVGGILVVYHNILRSAGDVTITVLMGVSEIITRIGCTFLFTAVFGYYGLWWVSPLTWCCAMLVGCVRYYSGKWKKKVQLQRGESIHG